MVIVRDSKGRIDDSKLTIQERIDIQREAARTAKIETFGVAGGGAQAVYVTPEDRKIVVPLEPDTEEKIKTIEGIESTAYYMQEGTKEELEREKERMELQEELQMSGSLENLRAEKASQEEAAQAEESAKNAYVSRVVEKEQVVVPPSAIAPGFTTSPGQRTMTQEEQVFAQQQRDSPGVLSKVAGIWETQVAQPIIRTAGLELSEQEQAYGIFGIGSGVRVTTTGEVLPQPTDIESIINTIKGAAVGVINIPSDALRFIEQSPAMIKELAFPSAPYGSISIEQTLGFLKDPAISRAQKQYSAGYFGSQFIVGEMIENKALKALGITTKVPESPFEVDVISLGKMTDDNRILQISAMKLSDELLPPNKVFYMDDEYLKGLIRVGEVGQETGTQAAVAISNIIKEGDEFYSISQIITDRGKMVDEALGISYGYKMGKTSTDAIQTPPQFFKGVGGEIMDPQAYRQFSKIITPEKSMAKRQLANILDAVDSFARKDTLMFEEYSKSWLDVAKEVNPQMKVMMDASPQDFATLMQNRYDPDVVGFNRRMTEIKQVGLYDDVTGELIDVMPVEDFKTWTDEFGRRRKMSDLLITGDWLPTDPWESVSKELVAELPPGFDPRKVRDFAGLAEGEWVVPITRPQTIKHEALHAIRSEIGALGSEERIRALTELLPDEAVSSKFFEPPPSTLQKWAQKLRYDTQTMSADVISGQAGSELMKDMDVTIAIIDAEGRKGYMSGLSKWIKESGDFGGSVGGGTQTVTKLKMDFPDVDVTGANLLKAMSTPTKTSKKVFSPLTAIGASSPGVSAMFSAPKPVQMPDLKRIQQTQAVEMPGTTKDTGRALMGAQMDIMKSLRRVETMPLMAQEYGQRMKRAQELELGRMQEQELGRMQELQLGRMTGLKLGRMQELDMPQPPKVEIPPPPPILDIPTPPTTITPIDIPLPRFPSFIKRARPPKMKMPKMPKQYTPSLAGIGLDVRADITPFRDIEFPGLGIRPLPIWREKKVAKKKKKKK